MAIGPDQTAEARVLTSQIRTAWTSFVTTGDPGRPAYDPEWRLTRIFDSEPSVTSCPEEPSRRLWQNHPFESMPRRLPTSRPTVGAEGESPGADEPFS